jgi:Transposase
MMSSQHSAQVIALVLEYVRRGGSVVDVCTVAGISAKTLNTWRTKYRDLSAAQIELLRRVESEKQLSRQEQLELPLFARSQASKNGVPAAAARALVPARAGASPAISQSRALTVQPSAEQIPAPLSRLVRSLAQSELAKGVGLAVARVPYLNRVAAMGNAAGTLTSRLPRHFFLYAIFAGGVIGGFAYGLSGSEGPAQPTTVPIDATVKANTRGNSYGSISSTMDRGWGKPQSWGTWMDGPEAVVLLGFDGPAADDVELLIEARARVVDAGGMQAVTVIFNDTELGHWVLPQQQRTLRRRLIVPRDVFNASTVARLVFAQSAGGVPAAFGLEALSLRDARYLVDFKGVVDHCRTDELIGWAVAEGTPVTVTATANGKPVEATFTTAERPDLPAHGLPSGAGFHLKPLQPIARGSTVEVRFANGRTLGGTPCTP